MNALAYRYLLLLPFLATTSMAAATATAAPCPCASAALCAGPSGPPVNPKGEVFGFVNAQVRPFFPT